MAEVGSNSIQLTEAKVKETIECWVSESRSLSIVVVGKTGAGKSTLINSLIGHPVAKIGSSLFAETTEVSEYEETINGVEVRLYDTPGLADPLVMETTETLTLIANKCRRIDLLLFAIPMLQTRMSGDDVEAIKNITDAFGKDVWKNAVFALTFANKLQPPPENREKDLRTYFGKRFSEWVQMTHKVLQIKAGLKEIAESVPVVPTGHEECGLPDRDDWFTAFWTAAFIQVKSQAQPALLIINKERFVNEEESTSEHLKPEKRPIVMNRRTMLEAIGVGTKYAVGETAVATGTGAAIGAGIGILFGAVGGPLGAAAGAFSGAKIGAGVGAIVGGGTLAYYIGDAILGKLGYEKK